MSIISHEQLCTAKRLLFISPIALGDFLYLKTFLIALKQQYTHIELDIWLDDSRCNPDSWRLSRSKILQQWIEAEGYFTRSYGCTDSMESFQQQIEKAKIYQYDLIICHSMSRSKQYSRIARIISPSAYIVSSLPKNTMWGVFNFITYRHSNKTFTLNNQELESDHHITDRYESIFSHITGLTLAKTELMPTLIIPDHIQPITQKWLSTQFNHCNEQGPLIFLNHLSTNVKKDWMITQLFELIDKISQNLIPYRFIINVTQEKYQQVLKLTKDFTKDKPYQIAVFTVQKHFFELPSLIAKANFVITVDTAVLHFAFATQRPLLAMMRQKKPYWAPPMTKQSHVLYAIEGKGHISNISVDTVYNQYQKMTQDNKIKVLQ
ncbi:glycosyltransferase family 9 protein [Shewanella sp. VB17]|uniref:glycosyltransferase family 9 protein n=1 Tax=Shewanella sp. VB17 TaxID=2739432 RepID=UPI0015671A30|nr:glycosyltransferase family 9 protein [Shewanella sp. VB17]NRD72060.1 glycosyltransferase family 9 protein [Shewanella sp. VB17]